MIVDFGFMVKTSASSAGAAASWWAEALRNPRSAHFTDKDLLSSVIEFNSRSTFPLSVSKLTRFHDILVEKIKDRMKDSLHNETIVYVTSFPDSCLSEAVQESGLNLDGLIIWPRDTKMTVSSNRVTIWTKEDMTNRIIWYKDPF